MFLGSAETASLLQSFFYKARPYLKSMDPGDLSERLALKEQLHCKKFEWYLHNIYPELLPGNTPQKYELVERAPEPKRKYQVGQNNEKSRIDSDPAK